MKCLAIATLVCSSLAFGCSKGATDAVSRWKDAACACSNAACAEQQAAAFWTVAERFKDHQPSADDAKKLDRLADQGQDCLKQHGVDVYAVKAS